MLCSAAFGKLNDRQPNPDTFNAMAADFAQHGVLDAVYPIDVRIDPDDLSEECLAAIKQCQDLQNCGANVPVLELKWWLKHALSAKMIHAAFGIDYDDEQVITEGRQAELQLECQNLCKDKPVVEILAGFHRTMATITFAQTYIAHVQDLVQAGDMKQALKVMDECKNRCSFWAAVYDSGEYWEGSGG